MSHGTIGTRPRGSAARSVAVIAALLLIAASWWQIAEIERSRELRTSVVDDVPVTVMVPVGGGEAPGVVVTHGFAGSALLMRTWATELTRAGFVVALPDLAGHGTSTAPLAGEEDPERLPDGVRTALEVLREQPEVDGRRLALLGHSMGSGAVLQVGLDAPSGVRAVVAVSPTDADVTPERPPNLLLLAGELEPRFVANAEDLLARAGGAGGDPEDGSARSLQIIAGVEHVAILFSPSAHRTSIEWLAASLGHDATEQPPVFPILWWAVHLVGVLVLWRALAPVLVPLPVLEGVQRDRPLLGATSGGVAATLSLALLGTLIPLGQLGGMLVGPTLALWFAVAGMVWLLMGVRPGIPLARDPGWAIVVLLVLVMAFGVLAARVWLPWWPSLRRGLYVPVFALLLLPWTLALWSSLQRRRGVRLFGWWLAVSAVLLLTLGAAAAVVPGFGFVVLLLPTVPVVLGIAILACAPLQRPWASGFATSVFLGWTIAILFPLG